MMKVTVHKDQCIAAGQCVLAAPEVFDQREDDGVVILLASIPPDGAAQDVRRAAALCPSLAITVEE
jgi:ferredoxin